MSCAELPNTGLALPALLVFAGSLLLLGLLLFAAARGRRTRVAGVVLLLLLGGIAVGSSPASSAQAAASGCPPRAQGSDSSLTITQTSIMSGLAPGVPAAAIAGLVVNNSADSTFVEAVTVSIASVKPLPGAAAGTCAASDYVLIEPRMRVASTLGPGGSVAFSGASIGFSDMSTNQDACKGATILLRYQT